MWWVPDESLHLFKPLPRWAKLWCEAIGLFAKVLGGADQSRWKEHVIPVFHSYYSKHYVGVDDACSSTSITIAMLASFIRKERKNRIDNSRPA
ncbi:hypothetical protein JG688_00005162 [Phytophthora aleatoria]|uniref:Uncharacterized protein n=1 Tax=Phytophthora aleatoria TaxID=2496075 RepID=A0A8J5IN03_9STRA|nr:hypothetical protein JG688_00005162 [Phytophthora aleatoria]